MKKTGILLAGTLAALLLTGCQVKDDEIDFTPDADADTTSVSVTGTKKTYTASNPSDASSFTNLVWSDEFNDDSLNTSNWSYETGSGGWGNNEIQNYRSGTKNCNVANGMLYITAMNNKTSARIITKDKKSFKYGKIEARIKMPAAQGSWPAFWMLGANYDKYGWPACGEIDIMEHVNDSDQALETLHWNYVSSTNTDASNHAQAGGNVSGIDVTQWHTYSIVWTDTFIYMYVDNTMGWCMNYSAAAGGDCFNKPFFILFNMAMSGNLTGNVSCKDLPWNMLVDYVRVYQ